MVKTPISKLLTGLFISLLMALCLGSSHSSVALAASVPTHGCFSNGQATTCPPAGTLDSNQAVMYTSTNCYSYIAPEQVGGASGQWLEVSCQDLTTPITATTSNYFCGGTSDRVYISIDFGCQGKGNPILDMLFAIIRLLSDGVGIVIIASVIVGGIQYTTSAGDPGAAAKATGRIRSSLIALLIFIFAYAILNYVIPGAILQ
jgi:hypothetical protein